LESKGGQADNPLLSARPLKPSTAFGARSPLFFFWLVFVSQRSLFALDWRLFMVYYFRAMKKPFLSFAQAPLRAAAFAMFALAASSAAQAAPPGTSGYAMRPMAQVQALANSMQCWQAAANYQKVDVWLLYSIAYVESQYSPSAVNTNSNGSRDLGMMQINSIHLPMLARYGITEKDLMDPCTSIFVGAWILRQGLNRYGYTWLGIGSYNSGNPNIAINYARRVYQVHAKLTGLAPSSVAGANSAQPAVLSASR